MKTNTALTKTEQEDLRHVILEILVHRHPAALAQHVIARHVRTELGHVMATEAIESALQVLKDLKLVAMEPDPLGATSYWQATAAGVLQQERL